jgi:trimethylamine:corrinoid methyltransferase-like protein
LDQPTAVPKEIEMTLQSDYRMLSHAQMARIHEASLHLLAKTGIRFHSREILDILKKHGARIEGEVARLPKNLVQGALEQCPQTYRWHARNPDHSVTVGDDTLLIQPASGCIYVQEHTGLRRGGTLADYIAYQQLCQASDVVALVGGIPIAPMDIPPGERYLQQVYAILKHTDKPIVGWAANGRQTQQMIDMVALAFGSEDFLETHTCVGTGFNPISPLSYGAETLEGLLVNARRNQAIFVTPAAMAGITAPVGLLGTLVLQNTETLAGLVLAQTIRPGVPTVYSSASTVGNLRQATFCTGSPEASLISAACMQMGKEFYHLPTRPHAGHTDAKTVDYQAGCETSQSLLLSALSGGQIIVENMGTLESTRIFASPFLTHFSDNTPLCRFQPVF